ncbi:unnamed protein product [Lymnaea stagnalis]|uniref:Uncharacterized protein n=1 Tax=Lymnaea stagnalis TaxID=6523 RepID=A0AAV2HBK9_LYMST
MICNTTLQQKMYLCAQPNSLIYAKKSKLNKLMGNFFLRFIRPYLSLRLHFSYSVFHAGSKMFRSLFSVVFLASCVSSGVLGNKYLAKKQIACGADEFACNNHACIGADRVCDTHRDCPTGEDEQQNCPTDCTGPHQFKCDGTKCFGVIDRCDGFFDCHDFTDEADCAGFECTSGRVRCETSHACILESWKCDNEIDCEDKSDEKGCVSGSCSANQWLCADSSRCIPKDYLCDGDNDCHTDHSDEIGCSCTASQFKCPTGPCIPASYTCDGDNDCGDFADEANCVEIPDNVCRDVLTYEDCHRMNQTTHPVCVIHADGHKFCRKYCGLCA